MYVDFECALFMLDRTLTPTFSLQGRRGCLPSPLQGEG
jgi:hypothetical protein